MKYQSRSTETGRTTYHDTSNYSPLTIRNNFQDAIPPGTVASRIQFLQNLANPIPSRSHPPPIRIHRGADSRTGFGRRLTNRFGKPALHNTNPDEEPQLGTSLHSFLGLNTPRINHEEQHAIADHRTRYCRSPGINGQIVPDGMKMRRQHDAVAPWAVLSRSKRTRSMGRQAKQPEVDAFKETISSRNQGPFTTKSSRFRSDSEDDANYVDLYRRRIKSRPAGTTNSDATSSTASTTRRQSVRDLFKDYGIERPAGLASRETSYTGNNPKAAKQHRDCHVCSSVNSGSSTLCSRCNHKLYSQCDALSPLLRSREKGVLNQNRNNPEKGLASKENWSVDRGPANQKLVKPLPSSMSPRKELALSTQKISQPPTDFPYLHRVETSTSQKKASQAPRHNRAFPDGPVSVPVPTGSQVPTRVRDSPFLIADLLASNRTLPSFPAQTPIRNGVCDKNAQNRLKQLEHQHGSSSPSDDYICGSPVYLATHHIRQPYRHAVSCIKKKRHRHKHKHTDNGYSADTSRVEHVLQVHDSPFPDDTGQLCHPHHSAVGGSRPAQVSRPRAVTTKSISKQDFPAYVECHGYPRTGHSRLGSPVSSGVIGECQHCLHDCHCQACQEASHSVRCCVHADHQAMVHHHLTHRKEMSASEKQLTKSPLDAPTTSDKNSALNYVAPIPLSFNQKSLAETANLPRSSSHQDQPVQRPTLVKMHSLPKSKTSSLMAGIVAKPPTPPPWISSPRRETKSGISTAGPRKETRRGDTDTALGIEPLADPPPPFKVKHTFPPPAPCDESSPETSRRQSNDNKATLHSRQEPDLPDARGGSYRRPSRSSIVEKNSTVSSSRSPSRMQLSPPGSRRATRRLSALFQLREKNTVPLLNQKLLEHQEELRRTQKECDQQMGAVAKSLLNNLTWNNERKESIHNVMPEEPERVQSAKSSNANTVRKMRWKLRLIDRKPSPACGNDGITREHRLVDDEVEVDRGSNIFNIASPGKQTQLLPLDFENHECVWKSKLLGQNIHVLGIRGVTVLLHLEGKEDVIFKAVDWEGGDQRTKA